MLRLDCIRSVYPELESEIEAKIKKYGLIV